MIESNKCICKICKELRIKTVNGYFPNSKNKRYTDENGKLWNGRVGPCCHKVRIKDSMRKLRFMRMLEDREKKDEV